MLSGPVGIPNAMAGRPSWLWPWGKTSVACAPLPCCLALLSGDFPGLAFPHIGVV